MQFFSSLRKLGSVAFFVIITKEFVGQKNNILNKFSTRNCF